MSTKRRFKKRRRGNYGSYNYKEEYDYKIKTKKVEEVINKEKRMIM